MSDSEISTSLPQVSRRELLASAVAVPIAPMASVSSVGTPEVSDPVLPLWREWRRLHAYATGLCQRWQSIEGELVRNVGFPQVYIPSSNGGRHICAQSHPEIDQAVAAGDCSPELGAALHVDFADRRARWDAEARALGFDEANRQELAAWRREEEAVRVIFQTGAATLVGVETKLRLMIHLCSVFSDDAEFPLPQVRSILADVKRLRQALAALRA
jgi:hypothetical protein